VLGEERIKFLPLPIPELAARVGRRSVKGHANRQVPRRAGFQAVHPMRFVKQVRIRGIGVSGDWIRFHRPRPQRRDSSRFRVPGMAQHLLPGPQKDEPLVHGLRVFLRVHAGGECHERHCQEECEAHGLWDGCGVSRAHGRGGRAAGTSRLCVR
jgi:hypothetical protein